jgi:hypothetical protein
MYEKLHGRSEWQNVSIIVAIASRGLLFVRDIVTSAILWSRISESPVNIYQIYLTVNFDNF